MLRQILPNLLALTENQSESIEVDRIDKANPSSETKI